MWIVKPIVAFLFGIAFVLSVFVTAIGTAVLLAIDLPALATITKAEVVSVLVIAVALLLLSAGGYTLRQFAVNRTLRMKLDDRRDLQARIDHLARLRSTAVNEIFSGTPKLAEFESWKTRYAAWEKEAESFLEENFPFAVVEMFSDLGAIIPYDFSHASKEPTIGPSHRKSLQMLAKQLTIIERLIRENSTLTLEAQPSFLELVRWEDAN